MDKHCHQTREGIKKVVFEGIVPLVIGEAERFRVFYEIASIHCQEDKGEFHDE